MSDISKTTINLPSDLKKELKIMAIREDTSLSGLIIKMINEGYEARKNNSIKMINEGYEARKNNSDE